MGTAGHSKAAVPWEGRDPQAAGAAGRQGWQGCPPHHGFRVSLCLQASLQS